MDENGEILPPMTMGELALQVGWPNLMQGLWQDEKRFKEYLRVEGWFLTGDIVVQDEEGYYYHQGRNDDLIKAGADKVIGPYEIERILCMHPLVKEAAVISKGMEPGQGVSYLKAFITLKHNAPPSARLNHEIKAFVKANLPENVVVQDIAFLEILPRTRSGKLLRRVLRVRELGLPGGNPLEMSG
jgi:acetyl-CoA synthetase